MKWVEIGWVEKRDSNCNWVEEKIKFGEAGEAATWGPGLWAATPRETQ
jgi:hypothetical protein